MKEICICAAVLTREGVIVRGHRHDDCIQTALKMKLHVLPGRHAQGFITSTNRYVDRFDGMQIQRAACSKSAWYGELRGDALFSEDLY